MLRGVLTPLERRLICFVCAIASRYVKGGERESANALVGLGSLVCDAEEIVLRRPTQLWLLEFAMQLLRNGMLNSRE